MVDPVIKVKAIDKAVKSVKRLSHKRGCKDIDACPKHCCADFILDHPKKLDIYTALSWHLATITEDFLEALDSFLFEFKQKNRDVDEMGYLTQDLTENYFKLRGALQLIFNALYEHDRDKVVTKRVYTLRNAFLNQKYKIHHFLRQAEAFIQNDEINKRVLMVKDDVWDKLNEPLQNLTKLKETLEK